MGSYRVSRTSEDIKREITAIIRELKDPRVAGKMLTVVRVEVSSDATFARVFISDFKGIESAEEAVRGMTAATGFIRREVGQRLHLRKTPELRFCADDSVERGFNMFKKLNDASHKGDKNDD